MSDADAPLPGWLRWLRTFLGGISVGLGGGLAIAFWLGPRMQNPATPMVLIAGVMLLGFLPAAFLEACIRFHRFARRTASPVAVDP